MLLAPCPAASPGEHPGEITAPDLAQELRADIASGKAVAALSAGATSGLGLLVAQIAFATFIFSGPLTPYASQGVGLLLFGNFAACLVIALAGGYRGAIAGLSPALIVGMAVIVSTMDAGSDALFISVSVALILCALVTGVGCLMIGHFRLANLRIVDGGALVVKDHGRSRGRIVRGPCRQIRYVRVARSCKVGSARCSVACGVGRQITIWLGSRPTCPRPYCSRLMCQSQNACTLKALMSRNRA